MNAKGKTVLIIDDHPTNLSVIAEFLENEGFEIMVAQDGKQGMEQAYLGQPDIILLDVMMPEIDGFETCHLLKQDERTKTIPVIFLTALANENDKVKGFEAGAVDYITKPIQHQEALARISH
ncbi:MAG: response regulator, partial [Chloroflexota bacterium]